MAKSTKTTTTAENPQFQLQKVYLKELSFSSPGAPEIFLQKQEPFVDVKIGKSDQKMTDDHSVVTISIAAEIKNGRDGDVIFTVNAEQSGIFLLKNIPAKDLPMLLAVECPNLLFPYLRQVVSQVSVEGGFLPFLLEPFNFMALYQKEQQAKGAK